MTSTFFGFETVRRALAAQQNALYTTGHNISNANTEGYSRQRVEFTPSEAYPGMGKNSPLIPGQIGTGVNSEQVVRIRNQFLDVQYRHENNKTGFYEAKADSLSRLEEIMNEPSENGLTNAMNRFWQSLQDLSTNPTDEGARAVVRERGIALTETFHYLSNSIESIKADTKSEIGIQVDQVNSIATQINDLNKQIEQIEINGYIPNDLYDKRDNLLDELSKYVDFELSQVPSGGLSKASAEGKVTINITGLGTLVDGTTPNTAPPLLNVQFDGVNGSANTISLGTTSTTIDNWNGNGSIRGLIDSHGYQDGGQEVGDYPDMLSELDKIAYTFAQEFNKVHQDGLGITEISTGTDLKINFFEPDTTTVGTSGFAKNIGVANSILTSLDNIAAAKNGTTPNNGDGSNATELAEVFEKPLSYDTSATGTSFESYYSGVIGSMGVESQEAQRLSENSNVLKNAIQTRKASVSSVSLDEEMANMIKFQHAYNAGARVMTTMDEILDKVINGMGRVGR